MDRRRVLAVLSALALGGLQPSTAGAQAKVTEDDPTAKALGYKADATKVDPAKFKQYRRGSACSGCNHYSKEGTAMGTCVVLRAGLVAGKGWCSAWVKKP
jgi:hypothetical protein